MPILERFGSLAQLMADHDRLQSEVESLKQREVRFASDPILRRRKLSEYSPECIRLLIIALQNELGMTRAVVQQLTNTSNHPLIQQLEAILNAEPVNTSPSAGSTAIGYGRKGCPHAALNLLGWLVG